MKRVIWVVLVMTAAVLFWIFAKLLPDIYSDIGQAAYKKGDYSGAYSNLKTALSLNHKHRDARYYFTQTLLKFKPTLQVQKDFYNISHEDLNDSADLIADRQISKWKNIILSSAGSNYIERAPYGDKVLRWDVKKFPLKIYIQNNSSTAPSYYIEKIQRAFSTWQTSTGNLIRFELASSEKDADILVTIDSSADMKKCTEEDCKYSVANTQPTLSGDILKKMVISMYDSNNLGKPYAPEDIFSTALHEIGHALGIMGHSQTHGDLMYMEGGPGGVDSFGFTKFSVITSSDMNTLKLLYKLVPDITNTPMKEYDASRQFFPAIVLGSEEQVNSAKIIEAQNYVKSAPDLPNGYMDLATAYSEVKQYGKAIEAFEKAISLCTNDDEKFTAYFNLALMYMNMKDWSNALTYANLAKSVNPSAEGDALLGAVYFNSGDRTAAKGAFSEAVKKDPTSVPSSVSLAVVYLKEFNFAMAGKILNNLVAVNPEAKDDPQVKSFSWVMNIFK